MRLVDADALKAKSFGKRGGLIHTSDIDAMPTVDAVPVVRCRDCKHYDGIRCFRWNSTIITGFNDYCSNGERKDDDHEKAD